MYIVIRICTSYMWEVRFRQTDKLVVIEPEIGTGFVNVDLRTGERACDIKAGVPQSLLTVSMRIPIRALNSCSEIYLAVYIQLDINVAWNQTLVILYKIRIVKCYIITIVVDIYPNLCF